MEKIKDMFKDHWIEFEIKTNNSSREEAEKKFIEWKRKNKKKYIKEINNFFDEIHPY